MFEFQPNSSTREVEYPWAFHATPLRAGLRSLDVGGSLSGFQFVLAKVGLEVANCDPGESANGLGWPVRPEIFTRLNARFGTAVTLHNCFLEEARFQDAHFDRIFSISTIEHIPETELPALMREVARILRPGGYFIATIDLFLDIAPFSDVESNHWGRNIDVARLVDASGLRLVAGTSRELHGFPDFDPRRIMSLLPELHLASNYPALAQCIVLEKPDAP